MIAGGTDVYHHHPVVLELNNLQNQLKEKERELGKAQTEIRALRATQSLKDKVVEKLQNEVDGLEEKLRANENHLQKKNLEIKKLADDKKEAMAAQYAAEATLRRVYANQKDDQCVPVELVIAPIEAELKIRKNEVAALQEDQRALERLTKAKETALLKVERTLTSALERALIVEQVQNQNFELKRQIEICQEENRILDKTNRKKVTEVEKLSKTIKELEEAILAGGSAVNIIRDYKRQISELNEEKRKLERELARVMVSENRIASAVANEWKDDKEKFIPIHQWLKERRTLQVGIQNLKDKLGISEKTARSKALMKEKLKLRLSTFEEGLKYPSRKFPESEKSNAFSSNTRTKKRSTSQPKASAITKNSTASEKQGSTIATEMKAVYQSTSEESVSKNNLWDSRSRFIETNEKENTEMNKTRMIIPESCISSEVIETENAMNSSNKEMEINIVNVEDTVSELKDSTLNTKDGEIKMLVKKVETLTRGIALESKKMKRDAIMSEKDSTSIKEDANMINAILAKR